MPQGPIPSKLFDLYNLFHSIFDDFDFQVYVSRAPPRKTNSIETGFQFIFRKNILISEIFPKEQVYTVGKSGLT